MTILNYALFALDAYQRGDPIKGDLSDSEGVIVNSAKILDSQESIKHGFYAIAYDTGSEIIIFYRGTDDSFKDILNGWGGGAGLWFSPQNKLAIDFYHEIKEANTGKKISLTGH